MYHPDWKPVINTCIYASTSSTPNVHCHWWPWQHVWKNYGNNMTKLLVLISRSKNSHGAMVRYQARLYLFSIVSNSPEREDQSGWTYLYSIVTPVCYYYVTLMVWAHSPRSTELTFTATIMTNFMVCGTNIEIVPPLSDFDGHRAGSYMTASNKYTNWINTYNQRVYVRIFIGYAYSVWFSLYWPVRVGK